MAKDRIRRRKTFTEVGEVLSRFDDNPALAEAGATAFIDQMKQFIIAKGLDIDNPKVVDKVIRKTIEYLQLQKGKKYMKHPFTKEVYHKVGKFWVYLDTEGKKRSPILRKNFSLNRKNEERLLQLIFEEEKTKL